MSNARTIKFTAETVMLIRTSRRAAEIQNLIRLSAPLIISTKAAPVFSERWVSTCRSVCWSLPLLGRTSADVFALHKRNIESAAAQPLNTMRSITDFLKSFVGLCARFAGQSLHTIIEFFCCFVDIRFVVWAIDLSNGRLLLCIEELTV